MGFQLREDAPPFVGRPQARVSQSLRVAYHAWLQECLEVGVIERSDAHACNQMVLVYRDGKLRPCLDAKYLNEWSLGEAFDPPTTRECIEACIGSRVFSTLDLVKSFLQFELEEGSRDLTTFDTPWGRFRFTRMFFGWRNATAEFQRFMTRILRPLIDAGIVVVYVDDVIVMSNTWEEHVVHLERLFALLEAARLRVNLPKCTFGARSVTYLGMQVDGSYVGQTTARLQALLELPEPESVVVLRSQVQMFNYLAEFVPAFAEKAAPLYDLVRDARVQRGPFAAKFAGAARDAWRAIRDELLANRRLALPDQSREFVLRTDASNAGVAAVLFQRAAAGDELEMVLCRARRLTAAEGNYSAIEKELLAIVWGCGVLRPYLIGRPFTCVTDHMNLTWMQQSDNPRVLRWATALREYDMDLVYGPGTTNAVADGFSRSPSLAEPVVPVLHARVTRAAARAASAPAPLATVAAGPAPSAAAAVAPAVSPSAPPRAGAGGSDDATVHGPEPALLDVPSILERIHAAQGGADAAAEVERWKLDALYSVETRNGLRLWEVDGVVVVPAVALELQADILSLAHDRHGHPGVRATLHQLDLAAVTWAHRRDAVQKHIASCGVCQRVKRVAGIRRAGRYRHVVVEAPMRRLQMDFAGPIPTADDGSVAYILLLQDVFTRWVELRTLPVATGDEVVKAFESAVLLRHGFPDVVQCDNGSHFNNELVTAFFKRKGITLHFSTPHHPASNGLVERTVGTVKQKLLAACGADTHRWPAHVEEVQSWCNTTVHRSIGVTPFEALYGREPQTELSRQLMTERARLDAVADVAALQEAMVDDVAAMNDIARRRMDIRSDESRSDVRYEVGQHVRVCFPVAGSKMRPQWRGLYRVIAQLTDNTYRLLDLHTKRETRAHVSAMRLADLSRGGVDADTEADLPPAYFVVESILRHRIAAGDAAFLVRWKGYGAADDTWVPWADARRLTVLREYVEARPDVKRLLANCGYRLRAPPDRAADR